VSRSMDDMALATEIDDTTDTTDELLDDELLVEEISIDGMCGVY
jgi:mycofactocin precursor